MSYPKSRSLLCILSLCLVVSPAAQALSLSDVKQAGVLRLATSADFAPFNTLVDGKPAGFEVDLGNLLAQTLGLKVAWTVTPFDTIFGGLDNNKYDAVIASHAITSARLKVVDFANPHYCTGGVVLTRVGGPTMHKSLEGQKIGAESGSTYFSYVQKLPFKKIIQLFPASDAAIQALAFGKVNAVVTDRFAALAATKTYSKAGLVIGEQLWKEEIGTAVQKGNTSLVTALNGALSTLMNNGQYDALSKKYFAQDIRC
jgi:polar amino acid transport system substrate-binding protein